MALAIPHIAALRQKLSEDGVICVRGLFDAVTLRDLDKAFDWSLEHPSDSAYTFAATADKPGRFYADINNPELTKPHSPYRSLLQRTPLGDLLQQLWQTNEIWFLYEQVLLKEGREARRTPWHQDASYLPITGTMLAVIWINLDSVAAEHSLEFVRASHKGPLYDGSAFDPEDDTKPIYGDGVMPRLPDIEAERPKWPIVSWPIEAGDVVVFHPAMLHGGAPTAAGMKRRTISLRFFGEDAWYTPLPTNGVRGIGIEGETIWDKLRVSLAPGEPLRHPDFLPIRPLTY